MSAPSPGYSITLRVEAPASSRATGELTAAIGAAGGVLTALDVTESRPDSIVVDVTCDVADVAQGNAITEAIDALAGFRVRKVSDRTFLMHLGGKLEVVPKVPLRHRDDLSRAYTPGVARICQAIAANPEDARRLTIKRNTVAVVTDGSAVLGLGNLGPAAALPVMEGKAALFKRFADVDAWPVCLDTQDADQIVEIVCALAPVYGGVNLEDIAAPRCFEIERRLRERLDIPVFHDDQHGTAIVVLAALMNALRVVHKKLPDLRVVISGVGAAGSAIIRILQAQGVQDIVAAGRNGVLSRDKTTPIRPAGGSRRTPIPAASPAPSGRRSPTPMSSSESARPGCWTATTSPRWPTGRSCSPSPIPTPRWTRSRRVNTPWWSRLGAVTSPTRSTTCSRFPGSSVDCSTPGRATSPTT